MCYLAIVQAEVCKIFSCQSFEKGDQDTCVSVNTTSTTEDDLVRSCDDDKYCGAITWANPEAAVNNETCQTHTIDPTIVNLTMAGDACENATECFGLTAEKSCSDGFCATNRTAGSNCTVDITLGITGHEWCPAATYCNTTTNVCDSQKAANEECADFSQCTTGYACLKVGNSTTFNCTSWFSVDNGTLVDTTRFNPGRTILLATSDVCSSHSYITPDATKAYEIECRTARVSADTTDDGLRRTNGIENTCNFTKYEDVTNATLAESATDSSFCGFNKDSAAYCSKRKGDSGFQAALSVVKGLSVSGIKCHPLSPLLTCGEVAKVFSTATVAVWVKAITAVEENNGRWANYANNDNCVKSAITASYWAEDDFAFNSFSMTSLAAMIMTISALFYMF
jgi:hypothetical protein